MNPQMQLQQFQAQSVSRFATTLASPNRFPENVIVQAVIVPRGAVKYESGSFLPVADVGDNRIGTQPTTIEGDLLKAILAPSSDTDGLCPAFL